MDGPPRSLDWSLVEAFLAVADTGSLSQAARRLGSSQPTVGRQIARMEAQTGLALFRRRARGLDLTEAGAAILPHARAMAEAMHGLSLAAAGRDALHSGTVRVTASVFTALHHLPPILARLRAAEPRIAIELVPSDRAENLLYREADIAVRMYRSEQLDIVTRPVGRLAMGIYAAPDYLARRGRPRTPQDLLQHDLVGFDRSDLILKGMRDLGWEATREIFATRCDDHATYYELLRAGCGIGFAQVCVAEADPALERLMPETPLPELPLWLAAHEAVRHTPRIRRVWDALLKGLAPLVLREP